MSKPISSLELNATAIEEIVPGLTFQWIFDGQGIVLTAQHTSRELVDAWADKIIEVANAWPAGRTLLILNDFSGKDCAATPYNQQKNRELVKMFPHLNSVTAMVVKQNLTMQLSRLFIRALAGKKNVYLSFSREEALNWLKKHAEN